jgi:hypothetical protein
MPCGDQSALPERAGRSAGVRSDPSAPGVRHKFAVRQPLSRTALPDSAKPEARSGRSGIAAPIMLAVQHAHAARWLNGARVSKRASSTIPRRRTRPAKGTAALPTPHTPGHVAAGRAGQRDDEILARVRQRFPSADESRRELAAAVQAAAASLTEIIGAFCVQAGMTKEQVSATLRATSDAVLMRDLSIEAAAERVWYAASDAVAHWWRDPKYLDDDGNPRDLPDRGPAPSLASLLTETVAPELHEQARAMLRQSAAVEERGIWRYCHEDDGFLRLGADHGADRLLMCVSGLCKNYLDNAVRRRDLPTTKNFDRTALVRSYPVALLPDLQRKLSKRLHLDLKAADAVLAAGEQEMDRGAVATVGVTMFMHTSAPRPRSSQRPTGG